MDIGAELRYVRLGRVHEGYREAFFNLMVSYIQETDTHRGIVTPYEFVLRGTESILQMQGPADRYLELCCDRESLVGFLYCKVDHVGDRGFIKPGYGYIMEFYVKPGYRRKGYGRAMFQHIESLFSSQGTRRMYLTADPVTGQPFWQAVGFEATGEISPENGLLILEKDVSF